MKDFILSLDLQFSDEEKQKCLPIARRMIELTYIIKEQGILALEKEVINNTKDSNFMKMGAKLTVNAVPPEPMEKIFEYYLLAGGYSGSDLLEKLLIAEGFLLLNTGIYPFHLALTVAHSIGAMLGEKYIDEIVALSDVTTEVLPIINEYTSTLAESEDFETRFHQLATLELQHVLMSMERSVLTIAFKGCRIESIYTMYNGLSKDSFVEICKDFQNVSADKEVILKNQAIILKHIHYLEDAGMVATVKSF